MGIGPGIRRVVAGADGRPVEGFGCVRRDLVPAGGGERTACGKTVRDIGHPIPDRCGQYPERGRGDNASRKIRKRPNTQLHNATRYYRAVSRPGLRHAGRRCVRQRHTVDRRAKREADSDTRAVDLPTADPCRSNTRYVFRSAAGAAVRAAPTFRRYAARTGHPDHDAPIRINRSSAVDEKSYHGSESEPSEAVGSNTPFRRKISFCGVHLAFSCLTLSVAGMSQDFHATGRGMRRPLFNEILCARG